LLEYLDSLKILDLVIRFKRWNNILLVVMYHEIGKNVYYDRGIPTKLFEEEIKYLSKLGFVFLPLCKAVETIFEEPNKPHRIAVLTFDDAYKGVYENALPIMLKHGIRGTIYPVAGFMERRIVHWASQIGFIVKNIRMPSTIRINALNKTLVINSEHDKNTVLSYLLNMLPRLDVNEINMIVHELSEYIDNSSKRAMQRLYEEIMMNCDQLKEMSELGFEVGGHGYWHLGLTNISKERLHQEIKNSLNFVNKFMNNSTCEIRTFAYPYGLYNNEVINVLKEIGFHAAATMIPIINKIAGLKQYEIGRIPPYRCGIVSLSTFKAQLMKT
jgi:peptidoglycan/xylan/chitin deacetylase (PgdA/CDA1 family)